MERSNKLCNAYVPFGHPESKISGLELITVREFNDYEGGTIIQEVRTAEDFLDTDEFGLDDPIELKPQVRKNAEEKSNLNNTSDGVEMTGINDDTAMSRRESIDV